MYGSSFLKKKKKIHYLLYVNFMVKRHWCVIMCYPPKITIIIEYNQSYYSTFPVVTGWLFPAEHIKIPLLCFNVWFQPQIPLSFHTHISHRSLFSLLDKCTFIVKKQSTGHVVNVRLLSGAFSWNMLPFELKYKEIKQWNKVVIFRIDLMTYLFHQRKWHCLFFVIVQTIYL